jgi:hypothetical protein
MNLRPPNASILSCLVLAAVAAATTLVACGGGEIVSVGRGGLTGNAGGGDQVCVGEDGTTYAPGDDVPSGDCNTCSCTDQGIVCTEMACVDPGVCFYAGTFHSEGPSFPAEDGCNTCSCIEGQVMCTEKACAPWCVVDGKTYQEGETWAMDCNTCECTGGVASCTDKACN